MVVSLCSQLCRDFKLQENSTLLAKLDCPYRCSYVPSTQNVPPLSPEPLHLQSHAGLERARPKVLQLPSRRPRYGAKPESGPVSTSEGRVWCQGNRDVQMPACQPDCLSWRCAGWQPVAITWQNSATVQKGSLQARSYRGAADEWSLIKLW